jgi:hypothetical protein
MGSGAVIYVPSFIKIGSGVQKLIRRIHPSRCLATIGRYTQTDGRDFLIRPLRLAQVP